MIDTVSGIQNLPNNAVIQPTLFIPHGGGPCFFMDWQPEGMWDGMADFLKNIAAQLPQRPKAILMISAHWQAPNFCVTSAKHPELIYDYYGFPEHTYKLKYPASGLPVLAQRITHALYKAGLSCQQDASKGFDHGTFIPLKLMFPEADIPVIQLSLSQGLDPEAHLAAGEALTFLRKDGVLIVGSGMSFHNMRAYGDAAYTKPSQAFDEWLTKTIEADPKKRRAGLQNWHNAPYAQQCHPLGEEEHFIPLMVAAGAAGEDFGRKVYSQQILSTLISAFQFG